MKAGAILGLLTAANLAWAAAPRAADPVLPVEAPVGTPVGAELLPGVGSECTLVVFFDPRCPFCGRVADAQRLGGLPDIDVVWATDDAFGPGRLGPRLPSDAHVVVSRALVRRLQVRAVPSAAWIRDGRLAASAPLDGSESLAELAGPCRTEAAGVGASDAPD